MRVLDAAVAPEQAVALLRRPHEPTIFFDGRGGSDGAWPCRVVVAPRPLAVDLEGASAVIARRRARGGPGGTGVVLALGYEGSVIALEANASIAFLARETIAAGDRALLDDAERRLAAPPSPRPTRPGRPQGPATSLPRSEYLAAVRRIQDHIARGDIYQANLTQRFTRGYAGDPWDLFTELARTSPAPRSAFLEVEGEALVSMSPEVFVDVDASGHAETRPIKGTRARLADPAQDRAAAAELLQSTKDRAELVMIVDLERNDLGRVAKIGSVRVPELGALRSYPAVHHLVARVEADFRDDVSPHDLLCAIFPGGSITGAPKERAIEIIAAIEPVPRGLFTGSLFWFDDDGSMLSSILIRSAIVTGGLAHVGAGGGIVADSEPEAEWAESNAKARAITRALGFEPEEAS